jgi:pheromone shutdown protein TraB
MYAMHGVQAINEFGKIFPGMVRPLMTERDLYLSYMLYEQATRMQEGSVMVAVVGAGHVPGVLHRHLACNITPYSTFSQLLLSVCMCVCVFTHIHTYTNYLCKRGLAGLHSVCAVDLYACLASIFTTCCRFTSVCTVSVRLVCKHMMACLIAGIKENWGQRINVSELLQVMHVKQPMLCMYIWPRSHVCMSTACRCPSATSCHPIRAWCLDWWLQLAFLV